MNFLADDLAIDFGSSTIRIYSTRRGLVVREPAVLARDMTTGEARAVGEEALEMLGRTPEGVEAVRPVRNGVIVDFEGAETLLVQLLRRARGRLSLRRPNVVLAVPCEATEIELRALREAVRSAGGGKVHLIDAPRAAAIGSDEGAEPAGRLVIDAGAGTTEVALLSTSGAVHWRSVRLGGDSLDEALSEHLKRRHGLVLGARSVERLRRDLVANPRATHFTVCGHDRAEGTPRLQEVDAEQLRGALGGALRSIVDAIRAIVIDAPPEIAADIAANQVVLCGGLANIKDLVVRLEKEIHMPVCVGDAPCDITALGCLAVLSDLDRLGEYTLRANREKAPLPQAA